MRTIVAALLALNFVVLVLLVPYLWLLPTLGLYTPSARQMLIWGNYTNVGSALFSFIAAGSLAALHFRHPRMVPHLWHHGTLPPHAS